MKTINIMKKVISVPQPSQICLGVAFQAAYPDIVRHLNLPEKHLELSHVLHKSFRNQATYFPGTILEFTKSEDLTTYPKTHPQYRPCTSQLRVVTSLGNQSKLIHTGVTYHFNPKDSAENSAALSGIFETISRLDCFIILLLFKLRNEKQAAEEEKEGDTTAYYSHAIAVKKNPESDPSQTKSSASLDSITSPLQRFTTSGSNGDMDITTFNSLDTFISSLNRLAEQYHKHANYMLVQLQFLTYEQQTTQSPVKSSLKRPRESESESE